MALVNGMYFLEGRVESDFIYLSSALTGNSVIVVAYMFCTSLRMCVWYKMNLLCLLLVQVLGITYDCLGMDFSTYLLAVVLLSAIGIMCFLMFRIFYRVTGAVTVVVSKERRNVYGLSFTGRLSRRPSSQQARHTCHFQGKAVQNRLRHLD